MRKLAQLLACLALGIAASAIPATSGALAKTKTSAGDNQYVDPLANTTSTPATTPKTTPTTTTPSSTLSQTPPAAVATTAAPTATPPAQALPFTGFNLWTLVVVGLGLVGAGLVLRLIARRTSAR
jgi:hypothetical protein